MDASATEAFMRRAIRLSRRGFPMPNPHVGCVLVQGEEVVGEGFHDHAGGPHAEVVALAKAGSRARGATAYVTLEPCNHRGRTGPCTSALIDAGVGRVVVASRDPNPAASGGVEALAEAGIPTQVGLCEDEARLANEAWLTAMERGRPFVVLKAAITLDGFLARHDGTSRWITGERARREAHRLRAEMGAVLVGAGTVLQDDPLLTAGITGVENQPVRVALDFESRLTGKEKMFRSEGGPALLVRPPHGGEFECPLAEGGFDLGALWDLLWRRGIRGILVEGGAHTLRSFAASGLADRLELFVAPVLFGSGLPWIGDRGRPPFASDLGLTLDYSRRLGPDLHLSFRFSHASREHAPVIVRPKK